MELVTNKAVTIGVGILVSLAIVSGVIIIIGQIVDIYKITKEADISLIISPNEFEMFEDTELYGVDLVNTLRRYRNSSNVTVEFKLSSKENLQTLYPGTLENWNTVINKILSSPDLLAKKYSTSRTTDSNYNTVINFNLI